MSSVCEDCRNNKKCQIHQPTVAKWNFTIEPVDPIECAYYSCGLGLESARDAVHEGSFVEVSLADGSIGSVVLFGSPDKQTNEFPPHRGCAPDGTIYGEREDGTYAPTGQRIFTSISSK